MRRRRTLIQRLPATEIFRVRPNYPSHRTQSVVFTWGVTAHVMVIKIKAAIHQIVRSLITFHVNLLSLSGVQPRGAQPAGYTALIYHFN